MNQIERIVEVTAMPGAADIDAISSPFAATMLESLPVMNYKSIPQIFPAASAETLDILKVCFQFNPEKRSSAEDLLRHVFASEFHNEDEEPVYPHGPLRLPVDDNTKLTAAQYRCVWMMRWFSFQIHHRRR